jgi:hypothetical protein
MQKDGLMCEVAAKMRVVEHATLMLTKYNTCNKSRRIETNT